MEYITNSEYKIDREGNVLSPKGVKVLPYLSRGRWRVTIYFGEKRRVGIPIARLLGLVFIPNPDNKPYVCHKDDDKLNDSLGNLYWGSHSDNMKDRTSNGYEASGEGKGNAKFTEKEVKEVRQYLEEGDSIREVAELFNVSYSRILRIKNRKTWRSISE